MNCLHLVHVCAYVHIHLRFVLTHINQKEKCIGEKSNENYVTIYIPDFQWLSFCGRQNKMFSGMFTLLFFRKWMVTRSCSANIYFSKCMLYRFVNNSPVHLFIWKNWLDLSVKNLPSFLSKTSTSQNPINNQWTVSNSHPTSFLFGWSIINLTLNNIIVCAII